jgi:CHASE3 domain sensor protein
MDVGKREDRFLDYIGTLRESRDKAVLELRFISLKNPDLKEQIDKIEELLSDKKAELVDMAD